MSTDSENVCIYVLDIWACFLKQFKSTGMDHTSWFGTQIRPKRSLLESGHKHFLLTKDYWQKKTVGKQS